MIYAARQALDGYTFTMGTLGSAITQPLISQDGLRHGEGLHARVADRHGARLSVVVGRVALQDLQELVAAARARIRAS